jgi:hypothetical protein
MLKHLEGGWPLKALQQDQLSLGCKTKQSQHSSMLCIKLRLVQECSPDESWSKEWRLQIRLCIEMTDPTSSLGFASLLSATYPTFISLCYIPFLYWIVRNFFLYFFQQVLSPTFCVRVLFYLLCPLPFCFEVSAAVLFSYPSLLSDCFQVLCIAFYLSLHSFLPDCVKVYCNPLRHNFPCYLPDSLEAFWVTFRLCPVCSLSDCSLPDSFELFCAPFWSI